jgi:hypothetical protein
MKTLLLNPEKQAALEERVNAEVERQVAVMVERLDLKLEQTMTAMIEKRIEKVLAPRFERLNGMIETNIDQTFHRRFRQTFKRMVHRLDWRIRDTHERLTAARNWVKRLEQFALENPLPEAVADEDLTSQH